MRTALYTGLVIGVTVLTVGNPRAIAPLAAQTRVNPDALVLSDFKDRVKSYLALRDKVDGDAPPLQQTKDPAKIEAAQKTLAAVIRKCHPTCRIVLASDAVIGDIPPLLIDARISTLGVDLESTLGRRAHPTQYIL